MSQNAITRRLRPYLFTAYFKRNCAPPRYAQFTTRTRLRSERVSPEKEKTKDYEKRVAQLKAVAPASEWYPRIHKSAPLERDPRIHENEDVCISIKKFRDICERYVDYDGETLGNTFEIRGRVQSVRTAGSKLLFVDLKESDSTVQAILQLNTINAELDDQAPDATEEAFKKFKKVVRSGDWYSVTGQPHRSPSGENSILATAVPTLLSPSLHQIPSTLEDPETRARNRHVDMLVNPASIEILRIRHVVETNIRQFLDDDGFTEVHTPLLTASAGGAVARPFETHATELSGQTLQLRIAPELWLKRLVVGGLDKVYEMGPAFRNEGVDATHNPEFSICEFYEAFATLEDLMQKTTELLDAISNSLSPYAKRNTVGLSPPGESQEPYRRFEFLPTLQRLLDPERLLPDLSSPTARDSLIELFREKKIQLPSNPTLPRLLDELASIYLEPLTRDEPTFITHHPTALSPLSKHFTCPATGQLVAARAELFINGWEVANMYEEENSPFVQREKFLEQQKYRGEGDGEEGVEVDESYLEALEWGLPPTGGWGCGVDRLVMLFAGKERIGDVLPFGTLRNVVGLAKGRKRGSYGGREKSPAS